MRRILRRRGAPPSTIDDAIQTAALRALQRAGGFDGIDGLVSWATNVAWHEVQVEWHRRARAGPGEIPEVPGGEDPGRVVAGRLALDAVVEGLATLKEADRHAILSALDERHGDDAALSAKEKMRRHRARQHLAAVIEDSSRLRPC